MFTETHQKVSAEHLARDAYLYVRQSSLRQVMHNTESTKHQYALRERAVALGWPIERIHTIDSDLGRSGPMLRIVTVSNAWSVKWRWGRLAWYWVLKSPGWRVTTPTGTGCLNWPHCPGR